MFRNRDEAGHALARRLANSPYAKEDPIVVCIPRGSLPLGVVIAAKLNCDLDICLVRRIVCPKNPDKTIAAVTEEGDIHLTDRSSWAMSRKYIEEVRLRELADIRQHRLLYNAPAISLKRRTVILVDDGIATGSTMLAAIHAIRKESPAKIVVATPVAAREAMEKISKKRIEELIVLNIPPKFMTLAQFYLEFTPVTDIQVMECLQSNRLRVIDGSCDLQLSRRSTLSATTSASSKSEDSSESSSDTEEQKEDDNRSPKASLPKHVIFRKRKLFHSGSTRTLEVLEPRPMTPMEPAFVKVKDDHALEPRPMAPMETSLENVEDERAVVEPLKLG